ncbi:MAG: hypothetical protein AB2L14_01090 [Candidatus Xenobiia bacterium LiM19]
MTMIAPGQPYTYNMNTPPPEKDRPENLYLSAFCHMHTDQTLGELDRYDGKPGDIDPRPGCVEINNPKYHATLIKEGDRTAGDFEGTGYISGPTGCAHHEDVKVHMESDREKVCEKVTYLEQGGMTLQNEMNIKTGNITFIYWDSQQA